MSVLEGGGGRSQGVAAAECARSSQSRVGGSRREGVTVPDACRHAVVCVLLIAVSTAASESSLKLVLAPRILRALRYTTSGGNECRKERWVGGSKRQPMYGMAACRARTCRHHNPPLASSTHVPLMAKSALSASTTIIVEKTAMSLEGRFRRDLREPVNL